MSIVNKPEQGNPDAVTEPDEQIPEKLRGKSPSELADLYKQLEERIGEQSEELGQLRRYADQAMQQAVPTPEQEIDWYEDPAAAVEQKIQQALQPLNQLMQQQVQQETVRKLDGSHPGWRDTISDDGFKEWVSKSKVRAKLYLTADAGDYDSAAELLNTYREISGSAQKGAEQAKKAVKKDRKIRDATTEKGGTNIDGRRVLRRVDLQELKRTNPDKYKALQPEIMAAYREGRVR